MVVLKFTPINAGFSVQTNKLESSEDANIAGNLELFQNSLMSQVDDCNDSMRRKICVDKKLKKVCLLHWSMSVI